MDALTRRVMGAVMAAAPVCATAADVEATAHERAGLLRRLLQGRP